MAVIFAYTEVLIQPTMPPKGRCVIQPPADRNDVTTVTVQAAGFTYAEILKRRTFLEQVSGMWAKIFR